jgi:hypothetical protein
LQHRIGQRPNHRQRVVQPNPPLKVNIRERFAAPLIQAPYLLLDQKRLARESSSSKVGYGFFQHRTTIVFSSSESAAVAGLRRRQRCARVEPKGYH